jgi:hypothetical protein
MHPASTRRAVSLRRRHALAAIVTAAAGVATAPGAAHAIVFGQLDDFENGTVMGWRHGEPSSSNPVNVPDGGPGGAGDNFMRNNSVGGDDEHSRQVIFNQQQWFGNYNAAGVTRIAGFMNNLGNTPLFMRIAIEGAGSRFSSTAAVPLTPGGGWQPVTFNLTPSSMIRVSGTSTLADALNGVATLRLLSAEQGPDWRGDPLVSVLGVDNLRAMTLPGDANFDGVVNLNDFNALAANFGATGGATWQQGDFNFDGMVNLNDFNLLASNFGDTISAPGAAPVAGAAPGAAVPEPTALGGLAVGAAALAVRRRRVVSAHMRHAEYAA